MFVIFVWLYGSHVHICRQRGRLHYVIVLGAENQEFELLLVFELCGLFVFLWGITWYEMHDFEWHNMAWFDIKWHDTDWHIMA